MHSSAFVSILPYLEQSVLYDQYDTAVSWGHVNNLPVTSTRLAVFECPSSPSKTQLDHNPDGVTPGAPWIGIVANGDYGASLGVDPGLAALWNGQSPAPSAAIQGSLSTVSTATQKTNGMLPRNSSLTFADVKDGLSNTIAVWETAGRPFVWQRGKQACEKLMAVDGLNVIHVEGGTSAWDQAGFPVVRGRKSISLERQVRIAAGTLVLTGAVLSQLLSPWWIGLSGFVGAGLIFSGVTDPCGMGLLLARMPWNRVSDCATS